MTEGTPAAGGRRGAKAKVKPPAAKNLGGRPRLEMSVADFRKLVNMAKIHCTIEECSAVFGISDDTLNRRLRERGYENWAAFYARHSAEGRASLRRYQFQAAKSGNVTAQIWLGKQILGQKDKAEVEHTGGLTVNILGKDADL